MMSIIHRFLDATTKLRVLCNEKAGRVLALTEEIGVGRGRSLL